MKGRDGAEKKEKFGMLVGFTFFQLDTYDSSHLEKGTLNEDLSLPR